MFQELPNWIRVTPKEGGGTQVWMFKARSAAADISELAALIGTVEIPIGSYAVKAEGGTMSVWWFQSVWEKIA
jgi:hypothetical protein